MIINGIADTEQENFKILMKPNLSSLSSFISPLRLSYCCTFPSSDTTNRDFSTEILLLLYHYIYIYIYIYILLLLLLYTHLYIHTHNIILVIVSDGVMLLFLTRTYERIIILKYFCIFIYLFICCDISIECTD